MRWTRKKILQEIKRLHDEGTELYYSAAERNHLNLVRAAAWHFGTWRLAVEQAGLDYESLSRYRRWSRERIIKRRDFIECREFVGFAGLHRAPPVRVILNRRKLILQTPPR